MEEAHPRQRNRCNEPPPADWDICYCNGIALWRCPAYRHFMNGEIRRCIICKRKSKWKKHLNGKHNFSRPEKDDDPQMIESVRNRLKKKQQISSDQDLRDEILAEIALISGKCDIPVSKASSKIFRQFAAKLISIGVSISQKYNGNVPNIDNFLYSLNESNISFTMNAIASKEKHDRLKLFARKKIVNVLTDAGTVLGLKCVHAMISHPGIDDSLPFAVYENYNFTQNDYSSFFSDIFDKILKNNLQIASVIIDQLPAQVNGITLCINSSSNILIKSIIIVPCVCHLTSLMFSAAIRENALISDIIKEIESFTTKIRKKKIEKYIGSLCPKIIKTRWLYVTESLNFILKKQAELVIGRANHYDIPKIPKYFQTLYDLILPLKILNILGSKRCTRLFHFVQYMQCAIEDFRGMYQHYVNDQEALEILNEIAIQFFARIRT